MNRVPSVVIAAVLLVAMPLPTSAQLEPRLRIQSDGASGVRISFLAGGAYQLEEANSLPATDWTPVTAPPTVVGAERGLRLAVRSQAGSLPTLPGLRSASARIPLQTKARSRN